MITRTGEYGRASAASPPFIETRVSLSLSCSFCGGNHESVRCPEGNEKTVKDRRTLLKVKTCVSIV